MPGCLYQASVGADSNRLVNYLSKDDVIRSLLNWVTSGLDELDHEDQMAESASLDHIVSSPGLFPSYQLRPLATDSGAGPDSPPLEPAKLAEGESGSPPLDSPGGPGFSAGVGLGEGFGDKKGDDANASRYDDKASKLTKGIRRSLLRFSFRKSGLSQIRSCRTKIISFGHSGTPCCRNWNLVRRVQILHRSFRGSSLARGRGQETSSGRTRTRIGIGSVKSFGGIGQG